MRLKRQVKKNWFAMNILWTNKPSIGLKVDKYTQQQQ